MSSSLVASAPAWAGTTTTTKPGRVTQKQAAAAYLRAVAPVNSVQGTFGTEIKGWDSSTSDSQAESEAQPLISAIQTLEKTLTNARWPANTVADIHTLIGDSAALAGDLQGLASVSVLNESAFVTTFQRDEASLGSAVGLVRHDLGLPPATGS
jgi:hypothetical protein